MQIPLTDLLQKVLTANHLGTYVGGEARARELVASLGITVDVFHEQKLREQTWTR